jgi:hypothetical protein
VRVNADAEFSTHRSSQDDRLTFCTKPVLYLLPCGDDGLQVRASKIRWRSKPDALRNEGNLLTMAIALFVVV